MNDFDNRSPHEPSAEFRAALRAELKRAYRADQQFGAPMSSRQRIAMVIGLAAGGVFTLAVGLVLGAATGYASAENLNARQRETAPVDTTPPSGLDMIKTPIRNAITALTCSIAAPQVASTQQGIPIVGVTPVVAKTTQTLGAVLGVRELPDGKVLVNDAGRRQIKIFEPSLANATVALDSAPGASNSYGSRRGQIFPYLGDSTVLAQGVFGDLLVLDHVGRVARALASPQFDDGITPFAQRLPMPTASDNRGRLIAQGGVFVRNGAFADSSLIYRADLDTRQVDVVGAVHLGSKGERNRGDPPEDGKRVVTTFVQPVPTEDAWAVLSDGTIAFVRGQDYHVDWVLSDGTKSGTNKLPFDWKRLTDEDKQKLMDSAKVVWDSMMVIRNARNAGPAPSRGEPSGDGTPAGRTGRSSGGNGEPGSSQGGSIQRMVSVPISDIPDFYPPVRRNSAIADLDGNLWILPTTSAQSQHGELVYDVVNPKKGLFQRVRMPVGRSIAGFGKGGVLYLQSGDVANGFHLERVKLDVGRPQK